jgi:hypothetical protein
MAETEPKSIFDIPPDDAEIEAGKGVPHERVREWLARLGRGKKVPPPTA